MATTDELAEFLNTAATTAWQQALFLVAEPALARVIVHSAIHRLARYHAHAHVADLFMLFQCILHREMRHRYRRHRCKQALWIVICALIPPRAESEQPEALEIIEIHPDLMQDNLASWSLRPEVRQAVGVALQLLPMRQRESFLLRDLMGLSRQDTARIMGCSANWARLQCRRARQTLAAIMLQKGLSL